MISLFQCEIDFVLDIASAPRSGCCATNAPFGHVSFIHNEGANHAFNNDTNAARYDKAAADLAWGRTVGFLRKHLA